MSAPVRLGGDELAAFTRRLATASPLHADMLATETVDAESVWVPAQFASVTVFHVVVHTRRRPIELLVADVADDSDALLVLGDSERVEALARRIGLQLETHDQVVDYVRFWCRAATRHTEQLVESASDFHWIPGVTTDNQLQAAADRAAHLARSVAVGHGAAGAFPAEVTMLEQVTLHLRQLRVGASGHVAELGRVVLMNDVPVAYSMP